ncbi:hypothetical protein BHF71_01360 [Vulcanibacillus modesticaldus]|uniref:Sporulation protein n=1 Tax=Vulcanibacillus modesticaldus TaxID=337097 RepID=A0A1D2YVU9_9BACI|nr:YhcN/YlaJ family sporulation lipoprotein [Vulcanibacillus modesticaldus]OEF99850.1 hypothetical protein BHF71_01360 [Vulcanibacillus modesticaldus]
MRTKKITILLLVSLLVIVLSACNVGERRPLTRGYTTPDGIAPYTIYDKDYRNDNLYNRRDYRYQYDNRYGVRDYDYRTRNFSTANVDADKMAEIAAKVPGVDDATVVIAGGNAYVALDLKDRVTTNEANSVEQQVYNALRRFATKYDIKITSDADLFGRLRDMGDNIREGTPLNRYDRDFRDFDKRFGTNFRMR